MTIVVDASAVLALLKREPGSEVIADVIAAGDAGSIVLAAANLAEVIGKLTDQGIDPRRANDLVRAIGFTVEPVTQPDALLAGALRGLVGGRQLSLGDRCCLALTLRTPTAEVWTGDRAWADLDLPITVRLIR